MKKLSTKTIGDFGEILTAFCLSHKYEKQGIHILRKETNNPHYDLLVSSTFKGTPFNMPTAIEVKMRGTWNDVIPPNKETLIENMKLIDKMRLDYWISFIKYNFENEAISFQMYLLPVSKLNFDTDFKKVTRKGGVEEQIITKNLIAKAEIHFNSRTT